MFIVLLIVCRVNEKLKELLQLQEDLSGKDVRISQITEELEKQRKKNNVSIFR